MVNTTEQSGALAAILGRDPELSLAELQALAAPQQIAVGTVSKHVAILDTSDFSLFAAAGGSTRLVQLAGTAPSPESAIAKLVGTLPHSPKFSFGISVFGKASATKLTYEAKEALSNRDIKARFIPSKGELNTAQIKHNGLLKANAAEWCLIQAGKEWHYGRTVWVPDFEGFAARDFKKPVADAKRGMLPPQLARVMVNLATQGKDIAVYDPFCGVGNLLMESAVTGHHTFGSDLEHEAVDAARENMKWLARQIGDSMPKYDLNRHDATTTLPTGEPVVIATEGYLGRPVRQSMTEEDLRGEAVEVESLLSKFFRQAHAVLASGARLVITLPAWRTEYDIIRLGIVDHVEDFGYTKVRVGSSVADDRGTLDVSRPNQRVIHELLILEKA